MKCDFVTYIISAGNLAHPINRAGYRCTVHNMDDVQLPVPMVGEQLCPIGRIERAADDAIARIIEAAIELRK